MCLPSCNNEDIFVAEQVITEEETPTPEDKDDPIEAKDDAVTTTENISVEIAVQTNDSNVPSSVTMTTTNPANGTLTVNDNGTPDNAIDDIITYKPNTSFSGTDSFDYTICDATTSENCGTATVTINITPVDIIDVTGELKAFPTAYGGGAYATGGRGGNVYHVTNLNDSGSGSFREALSKPRPATIVFDVSGTINITSWLIISGKDLTIAGQTAPAGGITITSENQSRFYMDEVENIIMRYIRIRMKDSPSVAFEVYGNRDVGRNLIFDHCSISYGGLQAFVIRGNQSVDITFQRGLIAESKTGVLFGDTDPDHYYSYNNTFINNLFYNVSHRLPNVGSNGRVDVINNVIQNWSYRMSMVTGNTPQLNHINNYYCMGGRSALKSWSQIQLNQVNSFNDNQIYTAGNIIDKDMFTDPKADNRALWVEFNAGKQEVYAPASEFVSTQYPLVGVPLPIRTAEEVYNEIITNPDVGANATLNANGAVDSNSDANDKEYLAVMAQGEGAYESYTTGNNGSDRSFYFEQRYLNFLASISSTPVNSRPPSYDTDKDGMPDIWELAKFETLDRDGKSDLDGDGYSDLEEFLNLVDIN